MMRRAQTPRGEFVLRVLAGRVLTVAPQPAPGVAPADGMPALACTRLVIDADHLVRELTLVHREPLGILPHRSLTLVTGCEGDREWPLYIHNPNEKTHRRFDAHIGWFLGTQGGGPLSEADQRVIWSAVLLQVLPSGTR